MRHLIFVVVVLTALLAACGNDDKEEAEQRFENVNPLTVPWRGASTAITPENAAQLELVGVLNGHQGTVFAAAFNTNGQRYATLGGDDQTVIWNLASGRAVLTLPDSEYRFVKFLSDGDTLLALDVKNNLIRRSLLDENDVQQIQVHDQRYSSWVLSPDERWIAVGIIDGSIKIYETETLTLISEFIAHHGGFAVLSLYVSPSGNVLYTVGGEGRIRSWNTTNWEIISEIENNDRDLLQTAVSPDGKTLAVVRTEQLSVFDLDSGAPINQFTIPSFTSIRTIAFSTDGEWAALGGDIDSVTIFDLKSGSMVVALPGHGSLFADAAFSADRQLIVTGISGGTAILWDLRGLAPNSDEPQQIQVPQAQLRQVATLQLHQIDWSTDGSKIMLIDRQGAVFVLGLK
ncbi:MAG: hypothetical protein K8I82_20580 [Anaerolineae bacterium]|nr:hypothetical protein [Anaerolineae bacterium]